MGSKKSKKAGAKAKFSAERIKAIDTWERLRAAGESAEAAAKKVNTSLSMLYYWKAIRDGKPWGSRPAAAVVTVKATPPAPTSDRRRASPREPEILELRQQIAALKTERDLLTQALAIFARRIS